MKPSKAPLQLQLRVTPRAKQTSIKVEGELIICRINAPPVDGKANDSVIALLSAALAIPKTQLVLRAGLAGRNKVVAVFADLSKQQAFDRISNYHEKKG